MRQGLRVTLLCKLPIYSWHWKRACVLLAGTTRTITIHGKRDVCQVHA